MYGRLRLGAVIVTSAGLLAGCSLGDQPPSDVSAGSLAEAADLSGVKVTVGGKEFTEQLNLCELTAQALESVGAEVARKCGLSGTASVRSALTSGKIDLYWEYTGTGWITDLRQTTAITDPQKLYDAVSAEDKKNGITWLSPAPANNTYAVAVSKEKADQLGVKSVSDYANLVKSKPDQASFCGAAEFFGRDDGWPGLQTTYGFKLPAKGVSELAAGAVYNSIDKANPCTFGEVFATDGRIAAMNLVALTDDKRFFTAYNPAVTIRSKVLEANPKIADALAPLAKALTDQELRSLNAGVDVDGKTPEETVKAWLVKGGFVGE